MQNPAIIRPALSQLPERWLRLATATGGRSFPNDAARLAMGVLLAERRPAYLYAVWDHGNRCELIAENDAARQVHIDHYNSTRPSSRLEAAE
jgi:hypothetical protein